jgi:hypothetical protein
MLCSALQVSSEIPSFHFQEHPNAPVHPHVHHHPPEELTDALIALYSLPLPNNPPTLSRCFLPRYPSEYLVYLESLISLDAHVSRGNGTRVRPSITVRLLVFHEMIP